MARLTAISGIGGKLPAAFLLEIDGRRLLLDLGEGPEAGVLPDISDVGAVDAICLSHAHMDHAGALQLAARLGDPPVYATAATFRHIPADQVAIEHRRILPVRGPTEIEGVAVNLGRSGHAPGGIWFHVPSDGGILYTGDWSLESKLLPFDAPPPADLVITDASYGDRDTALEDQIDAIASAAADGAVLPVPGGGRGPEMALALAERGLRPVVCRQVRREMEELAGDDDGIIAPERRTALSRFLANISADIRWQPSDVIIAVEANGEAGLSSELVKRRQEGFRFVFSSHVPPGTPAATLLAGGEARWLPWNVHPRLRDILQLAEDSGARQIVPAFVGAENIELLRQKLGSRLTLNRTAECLPREPIDRTKENSWTRPSAPRS